MLYIVTLAWREVITTCIIKSTYPVLAVRYEDLMSDTVTEMRRVVAFLKFTVTDVEKFSQALNPEFK